MMFAVFCYDKHNPAKLITTVPVLVAENRSEAIKILKESKFYYDDIPRHAWKYLYSLCDLGIPDDSTNETISQVVTSRWVSVNKAFIYEAMDNFFEDPTVTHDLIDDNE